MIDSVQDPGNVGTMIRTADAAGMDAVILGKGTADPYQSERRFERLKDLISTFQLLRGELRSGLRKRKMRWNSGIRNRID